MNPPPLPPRNSFAQQAASYSLLAPVLMILVGAAAHGITHAGTAVPRVAWILIGLAELSLTVSGLVLGIVALCGISRHGTRGLLGRGIAGVILNGILLALFAIGFTVGLGKGLQSRQFDQTLRSTEEQFQADQQKSFSPKTGITNMDVKGVELIRAQLDKGAQTLSGDDALVAQAMSRYVASLEDAAKKYQSAMDDLRAAHVLSLENLKDEQQLAARRETVQRFIAANAEFTGFISNSPATVQADLNSLQVPPEKADEALKGFDSRWAARGQLLLQIRDCDNRLGQSMLGILDVLDQNWGKWNYNAGTKLVKFDDPNARVAYRQFLTQIQNASQEQIQAQSQMVGLPQ